MSSDEENNIMDDDLYETILKSFVSETKEALETASSRILTLEQDPKNQVVLQEIFRIFHNIKGNAKAVGFMEFSDFAHKIENLLGKVRDMKTNLSQDTIDLLLASTDALEEGLEKALNDEDLTTFFTPLIKKISSIQ